MRWSICIITVAERQMHFERVLGMLQAQTEGHNDIEIVVCNEEGWSVGEKRQWCLDNASGDYICFVDDDDIVAYNYVDKIYPLLDGVDFIGFNLQFYKDGVKQPMTTHSLRHKKWHGDERNGWYRDVSHLNPIKRSIALEGEFTGGPGEDFRWANQIRDIPKTEHFINQPMYFYFYSPKYSLTKERTDGDT